MRLFWLTLLSIFLIGCSANPIVLPASTVVPIASPRPSASPTISIPKPLPTPTLLSIEPRSISGDLLNQIERLEAEMPRAGSEGFIIPTNGEKESFIELVTKIQTGELPRAGGIAAEFGYELIQYVDRGDANSNNWLLRELKPIRKGWGLYAFRSSGANDIIIEAPHPLYDEGTPSIAAQAYRVLQARALLIAGAHRDANVDRSSDVTHHVQSIFEAVHEAITKTNSTIVLQIHGFAASKHPGYPQIVLSSDEALGSAVLDQLAAAFKAQGVKAGTCGGGQWADLCGETNVQSRSSGPAIFIHIELDESLRADSSSVLKALKEVLTN
jgi:hypothetical protein